MGYSIPPIVLSSTVSGIGVLDKSVQILRCISHDPANLAELCQRTGLPRATAHRLAIGLETHRLLTRTGDGRWTAGGALRELASTSVDSMAEIAQSILPQLRDTTGESVQIYRREGNERICIASLEPAAGLRDTVPVGARFPLTAGSGAKILVAWEEPSLAESLSDAAFSERSLAEIRRRGWAHSAGERATGVASVSAPIYDSKGTVIAAISVSGPIDRLGRRPGDRWADNLLAAATEIQKQLSR